MHGTGLPRHSEEQILGILNQTDAAMPVGHFIKKEIPTSTLINRAASKKRRLINCAMFENSDMNK